MKISKIIFLSSIFFFLSPILKAHPFYVSICQVIHNEKNRSLELTFKIFTDDLIIALENMGGKNLSIGEENESPEADSLIAKYLIDNFSLVVAGKTPSIFYLGKETENDVTWCFLEIAGLEGFDKLDVENKILTEIYDTQSNIVNVTKNGITKSLLLNKRKASGEINF